MISNMKPSKGITISSEMDRLMASFSDEGRGEKVIKTACIPSNSVNNKRTPDDQSAASDFRRDSHP